MPAACTGKHCTPRGTQRTGASCRHKKPRLCARMSLRSIPAMSLQELGQWLQITPARRKGARAEKLVGGRGIGRIQASPWNPQLIVVTEFYNFTGSSPSGPVAAAGQTVHGTEEFVVVEVAVADGWTAATASHI